MRAFTDDALPLAVGIGIGILCAINGYGVLGTLVFVTGFYGVWKAFLWSVR